MLHVYDSSESVEVSKGETNDENDNEPKEIHVKDLLPVVYAIPRGTFDTDACVVHKNRDLGEGKYRTR